MLGRSRMLYFSIEVGQAADRVRCFWLVLVECLFMAVRSSARRRV